MTTGAKSEYTYREFCQFARRFNQVELLTQIARTAVAIPEEGPARLASHTRTAPWALAALAKSSVVNGNPHRRVPVPPQEIAFGCAIYNNITPADLSEPALSSVFNLLVRIAYEQFPYQESVYEELARVEAFFSGYSGRKQLEVLNDAAITTLLGAPVKIAAGVAIMLYASAMTNSGFFDPEWLEQGNFAEVLKELPREQIESVIATSFATDFAGFKQMAQSAPTLPDLEQYMFNPLTARPFLRLDDGRLLAPVPQLIPHRLSPIELYYEGRNRWDLAFTRDMGELLEDYVGRQLQALPDATVHAEITYGTTKKDKGSKSIDWIVVFDNLVLLVEAKSTRLVAGARAGAEATEDAVAKTLSEALKQIDRTHQLIIDEVAEFSHIPTDRPFLGLVATLDPWYISNSTFARDFLHQPRIPSLIGSVRNIESLVAIGQRRSASEVLKLITDDAEMSTWDLSTSLGKLQERTDTNPILDTAWKTYPFNPASDSAPAAARGA